MLNSILKIELLKTIEAKYLKDFKILIKTYL